MRVMMFLVMAVALAGRSASAQTADAPADDKAWSGSAAAFTYFVPDGGSYVQPAVAGDRDWLHLEGRFNYEDRDTGSAWLGYNFSVGERVTLEMTPMVGAVFGNTTGIAPGYKAALGWRALELSSETEYVIDTTNSGDSFLYTWSELALAPKDWYRFGVVVQRTKAYQTGFDIQRGLFAGVSYKRASVAAYLFNPDADKPTAVLGLSVDF